MKIMEHKIPNGWQSKTVDEVSFVLKGRGLSKDKIDPLGKNKCILYGQLFTVYNEVIKRIKSKTDSKKGNLNFNYKIALLPSKIVDYIIVHELCHLREFNHSQKFWNLIARAIPDYLEIRSELKRSGLRYH
ncbi:MAG: DUF45 domain-containing protein [Candidatus Falkowbacteria bacterium]|nr:DUF45 domain-containing protein [Candidatus Falkowbacteria bacterium]